MKLLILCLLALSVLQAAAFLSTPPSARPVGTAVQAGWLDQLTKAAGSQSPKVKVPDDFVIPEPQPLSVAEGTDIGKLLASSAALAVRLGTGATVLGWKVDDLFYQGDRYALSLGPLRLRDSSSVLADAPRPDQPLVLYAYDASPYCKIVRETLNLLDLTYEYRPCPGARQGQFSQDLLAKTGRQTVPYLVDPNNNVELFESADIINYLVDTYGPPAASFDDAV